MENQLLFKSIEENLQRQFDIECPEEEHRILTDKEEIFKEFKKWIDFWNSKRPIINDDPRNANINKLQQMKIYICDMNILSYMKELDNIGLKDDFIKRFK